MSAKWYHSHRGQSIGPLSDENIESMVLSKKLGPDDLVFLEGESKWRPLSEIHRFRAALNKVNSESSGEPNIGANKNLWVVLVKGPKGDRRQLGPFSSEDIRLRLSTGEFKASDYVWRHGMKNWYRILSFSELTGKKNPGASWGTPPVPSARKKETLEARELLQNVMELKTEIVKIGDEAPPEAVGPDLVKVGKDQRDIKIDFESNPGVKLPWHARAQAKATLEPSGPINRLLGDRRTYKTVAMLAILGFVWLYWKPISERVRAKIESRSLKLDVPRVETLIEVAPPAQEPAVTAIKPSAPVVAAEPTRKPLKPNPPSYIRLVSRNGELQIVTDASLHFVATITFESRPGELVGAPSFYRVLQRNDRNIDLAALSKNSWPQGTFDITVRIGEMESRIRAFVGEKSADYSQKLRLYNKGLTINVMSERVELINSTRRLIEDLKTFQTILSRAGDDSAWQRDYGPWKDRFRKTSSGTLRNIGSKSRNRYFFAKTWLDLQRTRKDLDSFIGRMARKSERTQLDSMSQLRSHLARIQDEHEAAQNFSLWK